MWPSFRGKIGLAYVLFRGSRFAGSKIEKSSRYGSGTSEVKVVFEKLRLTLTLIFLRERVAL